MSLFEKTQRLLVTCARGAAPFLRQEVEALGFAVLEERDNGVELDGTMEDAMRLNLRLRTAQRVLCQLERFQAARADELYNAAVRLSWEEWIPADGYFTIASFVKTETIRDTRFANLKCKDAIADRIRQKLGRRPDSGNERNGAVVFLYWNGSDCRLYLDTSGEALSRRGYRRSMVEAPMQESLAAAIVAATGWSGVGNFINPMCGSGTLAIEAALAGLGRPPGLLRSRFGFMHLIGFDAAKWEEIRREAKAVCNRKLAGEIVATDINPAALDAAKRNATTAGVEQLIKFSVCDFADTPVPPGGGVVVLNPEYGERTGADKDLEDLYSRIGDFFKQKCQGYMGYIFTGNLEMGKRIGLRSKRRIMFFNGPIECRLLGFDLYEGTKRRKQPEPDSAIAYHAGVDAGRDNQR